MLSSVYMLFFLKTIAKIAET